MKTFVLILVVCTLKSSECTKVFADQKLLFIFFGLNQKFVLLLIPIISPPSNCYVCCYLHLVFRFLRHCENTEL